MKTARLSSLQKLFSSLATLAIVFSFSGCETYQYLADPSASGQPPAYIRGQNYHDEGVSKFLMGNRFRLGITKINGQYTEGSNFMWTETDKDKLEQYTAIKPGEHELQVRLYKPDYNPVDGKVTFTAVSGQKYQAKAVILGGKVMFIVVNEQTQALASSTGDPVADALAQALYDGDEKIKAEKAAERAAKKQAKEQGRR